MDNSDQRGGFLDVVLRCPSVLRHRDFDMKINYSKSMLENLMDAVREADEQDREIDSIEINEVEWIKLRGELDDFPYYDVSCRRPLRLQPFEPGLFVGMVMGVSVYHEAES